MADSGGQYLPRRVEPSRFGWLLLGYRRSAGLTQEELASAARVSVQTIGNLERGRARDPSQALPGLAGKCRCRW
jgi:transcriptional regulator with XRE-family HTH domain